MRSKNIPKLETGVHSLRARFPKADGTGVTIAVMDTGCDLRAAGLSGTTSDGVTPKYVDFIDCTGDGDVRMSRTVEVDYAASNKVEGLSGRVLTLGEWAKDVKEMRLGAVRLYDLLPRGVERRVKGERKEEFMARHGGLISRTQISLDALNAKKKDEDGKKGDAGDQNDASASSSSSVEKERKELELLLEQLRSISESYEDHGPLLDVLTFLDEGGTWRAVIDVDASGDLTKSVPMAAFRVERQVGELGFGSHVSFCVQFYDGGETLSVVTDAGSHGTHVAGISAAYHGPSGPKASSGEDDEDDRNGVAPGARILALKIGDGRLGSTETGTGLIRGLIAAKRHGCDLINLSYGEPSRQPDRGRVSEVFTKASHDWGMTVFTSAGNDGPALSSLGSPGSLTAPVTVGAYVSPEMMAEQYSTLPPLPEEGCCEGDGSPPSGLVGSSYYFSSRGPTPDGYMPDVCGPGGAISPVPRHALQGKAQYHGTSMSSPNVCGVAACVLSAVRSADGGGGRRCGPVELKRALANTARPCGVYDPFSQGSGLVSALDCAEYIIANRGKAGQGVAIDVTVPSRNGARGVYVRDEIELESLGPVVECSVAVNPRFSHAVNRTPEQLDELLSLEIDLSLRSSEAWVTCPGSMVLLSAKERGGQSFSVRLDTRDLGPGAHFATVDAFDASDEGRGRLFSLPITVIVPHSRFVSREEPVLLVNEAERFRLKENGVDFSTKFELKQGVPNRRFVTVPSGAEWATIKLKSNGGPASTGPSPRIIMHAVPFVRGDLPNTECQLKKLFEVKEDVEEEYHMRVKGGSCLEVCLQLLWLASASPASVTADIEFHSLGVRSPILSSSQPVTITAASEFARLGASAPLRAERLNPTCSLKWVRRTLRAQDVDIKLGSIERDGEPPSDAELTSNPDEKPTQIYEMRLTYQFTIEGDKAIEVTPSFPSLFSQLYDSPLDSQLWSLVDSSSRVLTFGSSMHEATCTSLKKGNYTVTLLLRHPNRDSLDQMKAIPCEISLKLSDALTCKVYERIDFASTPNIKDAVRSPLQSLLLRKGSYRDLYVARPTDDLPPWAAPGDVVVGSLVLDKDKESVTSMVILYVVPPKKKDGKKEEPGSEKKDSLEDTVFKSKLGFLAGLRTKDATLYQEVAAGLKKERPSSVPLLSELLAFALETSAPSDTNEDDWRAKEIEIVYDSMQKANGGPVDSLLLAQYFGQNAPDKDELEDDEEAKTLNREMTDQRDALRKILLARAALSGKIADKDATGVSKFDEAVKELKKWVTVDSLKDEEEKLKLSILLAKHARICQKKNASAISMLLKTKKELNGKGKIFEEELINVYEECGGMEHLIRNVREGIQTRFPVMKRGI